MPPMLETLVKGDLIKVINKCPATKLAASRTERVRGRIKFLTNSIKTITGIKAYGVPRGTKCAKNSPEFNTILHKKYLNHLARAKLTEKDK